MNEKNEITKLQLHNSFMTTIVYGMVCGMWTRFYNENLGFAWIQGQVLIMTLVPYIVNCRGFELRKKLFNTLHIIRYVISAIDTITIALFMFTKSAEVLMVGDTLCLIVSILKQIGFREINNAVFRGNERSAFDSRREKYCSGADIIGIGVAFVISLLIIGDSPIPYNILILTQIIMNIVEWFVSFRVHKVKKLAEPFVYEMWLEK